MECVVIVGMRCQECLGPLVLPPDVEMCPTKQAVWTTRPDAVKAAHRVGCKAA